MIKQIRRKVFLVRDLVGRVFVINRNTELIMISCLTNMLTHLPITLLNSLLLHRIENTAAGFLDS